MYVHLRHAAFDRLVIYISRILRISLTKKIESEFCPRLPRQRCTKLNPTRSLAKPVAALFHRKPMALSTRTICAIFSGRCNTCACMYAMPLLRAWLGVASHRRKFGRYCLAHPAGQRPHCPPLIHVRHTFIQQRTRHPKPHAVKIVHRLRSL